MKKLLYFVLLLTACQPASITTTELQTLTESSPGVENTLTTPSSTSGPASTATDSSLAEWITLITEMPSIPVEERQGYFSYPSRYGDAGLVSLYPGRNITITWEEAPQAANQYDILFIFFDEDPILLGMDENDVDGVQVEWLVPELIGGTLVGIAYYDADQVIYSGWSHEIYSGELPPDGVCSLSSSNIGILEFYSTPDIDSAIVAYLIPGEYAMVDAKTESGWFRVDASEATDPSTGESAEGAGWVGPEQYADIFGPCEDLELIEN